MHEENLSSNWFKNMSTFGSRTRWHKDVDYNVHRHWTWIFIFLVIIFAIWMLPGNVSTNKCHHFCHPSHFTESTSPVGSVQKSSKPLATSCVLIVEPHQEWRILHKTHNVISATYTLPFLFPLSSKRLLLECFKDIFPLICFQEEKKIQHNAVT